jgi:hypothetical protein
MQPEIGKEYTEVEIDFLTKLPWRETKVTYLGLHPYDGKHLFASEIGGVLQVPNDGKFFSSLK